MKPARSILIIGEDEERVSLLRYVLRNSNPNPNTSCYSVTSVGNMLEVVQALQEREYDLMLVFHPVDSIRELLTASRALREWMPIIVLSETKKYNPHILYDGWLFRAKTVELLEIIRVMVKKQKGPRKGSAAAFRCGAWRIGKRWVDGEYVVADRRAA